MFIEKFILRKLECVINQQDIFSIRFFPSNEFLGSNYQEQQIACEILPNYEFAVKATEYLNQNLSQATVFLPEQTDPNSQTELYSNTGCISKKGKYVLAGHGGLAIGLKENRDNQLLCTFDCLTIKSRMRNFLDNRILFSSVHPFGLIPGCLSVEFETAESPTVESSSNFLEIRGWDTEIEPIKEFDEAETTFDAMSTACRNSLTSSLRPIQPEEKVSHWYSDWNNSRYRATELSFAIHRMNEDFLEPNLQPTFPALKFGDVGASSMPLALAMALYDDNVNGLGLVTAGSWSSGLRSAIFFEKHMANPTLSKAQSSLTESK